MLAYVRTCVCVSVCVYASVIQQSFQIYNSARLSKYTSFKGLSVYEEVANDVNKHVRSNRDRSRERVGGGGSRYI